MHDVCQIYEILVHIYYLFNFHLLCLTCGSYYVDHPSPRELKNVQIFLQSPN